MDEVEEILENLMHNEIDYLDLSFEFAQQAPFTTLLYNRRLPDFSDEEFQTLLAVLMNALQENRSVSQVHLDWSFLRILQAEEQEFLFRRIGGLPRLKGVSISGSTANVGHQHISVFNFMRVIVDGSIQTLTMDAMGSLKLQDFTYVEHFSDALLQTASTLRVLRLENLLLPQEPNFHALDRLISSLTTCSSLNEVHLSVSLPRQYRRITQPLVQVAMLGRLVTPTIVRLHNFGLQPEHGLKLLSLPNIVTLDVWNNFVDVDETSTLLYRRALCQQMTLHEFRGVDDSIVDRYLFLNRCGRAVAGNSWSQTLDYWAAISVAGAREERRAGRGEKTNVTLDALYTAIRAQPLL